ncbi:MAG: DnaJ domain-containing protein [Rhodospirillales bacterium]|nr:DnaJ domain-containing protein [Rhodospirillales bacterium]
MPPILLAALGALIGLALLLYGLANAPPKRIRQSLVWGAGGLVLLSALFLAFTGRLGWAVAAMSALAPWVIRLLRIHAVWRAMRSQFGWGPQGPSGSSAPPRGSGPMTREEAYATLGLKQGASREEIQVAYKRLMQKVHPDKGGSDALAARLNQARDILLG